MKSLVEIRTLAADKHDGDTMLIREQLKRENSERYAPFPDGNPFTPRFGTIRFMVYANISVAHRNGDELDFKAIY
jgi:hypothetical protein